MTPVLNASLDALNTLALTSRAAALVSVDSLAVLTDALNYARANGYSVMPLGEGSNVVLADDIDALVLRLCTRGVEVLEETSSHVTLRVAAGENWHELVTWTVSQGYFGLENLALIPGTVGAAPIQNIGAYGVELCESLTRVHGVYLSDHNAFTLESDECQFRYRDSVFKGELRDKVVLTAIELRLSKTASPTVSYPALAEALASHRGEVTPEAVMQTVVQLRQSKLPDPADTPNAGSFFKNPVISQPAYDALKARFAVPGYPQVDGSVKVPAAWLIEHCGWKGHREAGQGVHPAHALVLVNYGNGSGRDLLTLAGRIVESVQQEFDIRLDIEPRVYGAAA